MIRQYEFSEDIPMVMVRLGFLGSLVDIFANEQHLEMMPFTEEYKGNAYNPIFENPRTLALRVSQV